eukprot:14998721-Alexandrium_andersonii.AAC.1
MQPFEGTVLKVAQRPVGHAPSHEASQASMLSSRGGPSVPRAHNGNIIVPNSEELALKVPECKYPNPFP